MGREIHANGMHIDTRETQKMCLIPSKTLFTIEPGVSLPVFAVCRKTNIYLYER